MARRDAFGSFLRAAARASAAAQREHQRAIRSQLTQARQIERQERMARTQQVREEREVEKLAKQQYIEDRIEETEDLNTELAETLESLEGLLAHTLRVDDRISFDELRMTEPFEKFVPPAHLAPGDTPRARPVLPPSGVGKFLPGASGKYQRELLQAEADHREALEKFNREEMEKRAVFAKLKEDFDKRKALYDTGVLRRNTEVDEFQRAYLDQEPEAIVAYTEMVLARSEYPSQGFPQKFRVAFNVNSSELIVEYDLPELSVVPEISEYHYVKSKDSIESKPRKVLEIKQIYQDVIASIALRTVHEVFEADQAHAIALTTFTGILDKTDPATGRPTRIPVLSVRVSKQEFETLNLAKVEKLPCLRNLGAQVSARPEELQAIKPIVEFDMVDKRFVDQGNALAALESRPNLLELSPSEFETLVANLFGKMGLDTKLTRASRDGGVDAIAFDTRPVLGGKVVIQAKRYRDTVGISAVRDLYGTMKNEGANKGILVCTSGYGADAYNFTKDKPIELIDGGGLLYLLREHAGVAARIAA
jgi:restriction system protein